MNARPGCRARAREDADEHEQLARLIDIPPFRQGRDERIEDRRVAAAVLHFAKPVLHAESTTSFVPYRFSPAASIAVRMPSSSGGVPEFPCSPSSPLEPTAKISGGSYHSILRLEADFWLFTSRSRKIKNGCLSSDLPRHIVARLLWPAVLSGQMVRLLSSYQGNSGTLP